MSSMNNLSVDGQFRYIVQWFNEWSELQRDDFVPVLIEYVNGEKYINGMEINGVIGSMANADINDDKPMSLFQCRIKLFRDWSPKWPIDFKHKLKEKIVEMDTRVGEKIIGALKGHNESHSNGNGVAADDDDEKVNGDGEEVVATAVEAEAEEAISTDAVIITNETSVDDEPTVAAAEPAEPVEVQAPLLEAEHVATAAAVVVVATNNAEVPSIA